MIAFVHKLDFNDKKYQTNGTLGDEIYKKHLLSSINNFVSICNKSSVHFYYVNHIFKI